MIDNPDVDTAQAWEDAQSQARDQVVSRAVENKNKEVQGDIDDFNRRYGLDSLGNPVDPGEIDIGTIDFSNIDDRKRLKIMNSDADFFCIV